MPQRLAYRLGLTSLGTKSMVVADGRSVDARYYKLRIEWQGELKSVEAVGTDSFPLIGMGLMQHNELRMMVEDDGIVEITRFDRPST